MTTILNFKKKEKDIERKRRELKEKIEKLKSLEALVPITDDLKRRKNAIIRQLEYNIQQLEKEFNERQLDMELGNIDEALKLMNEAIGTK